MTGIYHLYLGVPYVPTSRRIAAAMVSAADLRGGEVVYDLGAGDARLLILAKRRCPGITARGCELVPTIWLLGKFRILCSRQTVDFRWISARAMPVTDANVVLLYATPSLMADLERKFDAELRPGTRILSNTFRFPSRKPEREVTVALPFGRTRRVWVYRW